MESPSNIKPILEVQNISMHFSGVYALKDVSIEVFPGKVNALIGENGAGKSTLMKLVSGVYRDYEGKILLNDQVVRFANPKEAMNSSVVIIHQELNLFPDLSVAENLFLGQEPLNRLGLVNYQEMHRRTKELLGSLQLSINPTTKIRQLRVGQQQLIEIARALLFDSKVLIMDEPTSAISDHEVRLLFRIINDLKAKGVAIVYISHKLDELFKIADYYTVLRDGRKIGSGMMKETDEAMLIRMMVGRKLAENIGKEEGIGKVEVLRVENLQFRNPLNPDDYLVNNVSFILHRGEVLGIYGLMGAGRTELLEAIFGLFPKHVLGKIFIDGKEKSIRHVSDAIQTGIGLVPEDRKLQGLVMNMNVARNTSLASLNEVSRFSFINRKKEAELSRHFIDKLQTQVALDDMEVEKLSGGNQQKVVIAKWLATHPRILLLDEPTRGIDIGAKAEIYKLIRELAHEGMGIVMVSSELPEILAISDTIMVLSESRQKAILKCSDATEEIIMEAALSEKELNITHG
jgi:ribose transport system ATP-binding protein